MIERTSFMLKKDMGLFSLEKTASVLEREMRNEYLRKCLGQKSCFLLKMSCCEVKNPLLLWKIYSIIKLTIMN